MGMSADQGGDNAFGRAQIKRVIILGDGKAAMAEVPVEGYALPPDEAPLYDRIDPRCVRALYDTVRSCFVAVDQPLYAVSGVS